MTGCSEAEKEVINVGAKDFAEQYILGNMLSLLIEEHTDLVVNYSDNMASHVIFAAISTGVIDVYIDYTGTIYGYYLNFLETRSAEEVYEISAREINERYDLRLLGKLGFNNTFNLAVRQDTADEFNLKTFSDLALVSENFIFGGSAEIINRNDGLPNLKKLYDMEFKEERIFHNEERYPAIANNKVQVSEVFATDGQVIEYGLVVLEDDKNFFPPYHGVVVIRNEIVDQHPELVEILGKLEGILTDDVMRAMNYRAEMLNESPRDIAEEFLRINGLIS